MREIYCNDLKVGMLVVPDSDVFMLGDRWVVENIDGNHITLQIYHCGVCLFKNSGWHHFKIDKTDWKNVFWTKDETMDSWIYYHTSDEKRRLNRDAVIKQMEGYNKI